ncbi:NAD(P)/FAD-dependent oxidoreductase [Salarchaeum japonicum]|uniref:NAD(P)/FAD-dependent oxidoreductase n=2 Tax=Salarchaeum japonicum TaxID=555573 RepID=A0AAV3SYA5_9EURY
MRMRVVVLGGGYAGLLLTRKLEDRLPRDAELLLVDDTGDHLVQHELHRVIRKPGLTDAITIPLTDLTERAEVREDTVRGIDTDAKTVSLDDGGDLEYDAVAVCLGAQTAFYDLPGVEEHATPMKRLEHAARARRDFEGVLDTGGGTVVVGGAGLSGVQVAGEFAALAREEGVEDDVDVVLVDRSADVTTGFPENFRRAVRRELDRLDVTVHTNAAVTGTTDAEVEFAERDPIAYDQFVWTGGIRGPDALDGERRGVRGTLEFAENAFAVGDAARVVDADGAVVPASAQAAVRATDVAARNLLASLEETDGFDPRLEQWRFESPGWLVSVGDGAVAQLGPEVLTGKAAEVVKSSVGVAYLAEHGSLRNAIEVVREDVEGAPALPDLDALD